MTIRPRRPSFDWTQSPLHWLPGDPFTTHLVNVLHLLLPAGERWFVRVYQDALPLIKDDKLREDARGFMGQEAVHARAHAAVLEHLAAHGVETAAYTKDIDWLFEKLLGDEPFLPWSKRTWLMHRLSIIAAIEHFTCVLGNWILEARAFDEAGADEVMLGLLRWHGAEEVEHRAVAFDVYRALGGSYALRVLGMLLVTPVFVWLWSRGTGYFLRNDPTLAGKRFGRRDFLRAVRRGRAPGWEILRAVPRYLSPWHHPSREGSLDQALGYLRA